MSHIALNQYQELIESIELQDEKVFTINLDPDPLRLKDKTLFDMLLNKPI